MALLHLHSKLTYCCASILVLAIHIQISAKVPTIVRSLRVWIGYGLDNRGKAVWFL